MVKINRSGENIHEIKEQIRDPDVEDTMVHFLRDHYVETSIFVDDHDVKAMIPTVPIFLPFKHESNHYTITKSVSFIEDIATSNNLGLHNVINHDKQKRSKYISHLNYFPTFKRLGSRKDKTILTDSIANKAATVMVKNFIVIIADGD